MPQITNHTRCCATCEFWLGSRNPNRLGYVEIANRMDSGKCGLMGLNESRKFQAVFNCRNYRKWQVLR